MEKPLEIIGVMDVLSTLYILIGAEITTMMSTIQLLCAVLVVEETMET